MSQEQAAVELAMIKYIGSAAATGPNGGENPGMAPKQFEPLASAKLPKSLLPTSIQVMKYTGRFITITDGDDNTSFDWAGFKQSIDAYKGDDLTFDKYKQTTITRSEATVKVMVKKIVKFFLEALSATINEDELVATLEATFTNLKIAKSRGCANFRKSSSSSNRWWPSWEYRILFSVPVSGQQDFFYSLVTTIKLEADMETESSWWGLTRNSSSNFSATIDAMELVVLKGFRNPMI